MGTELTFGPLVDLDVHGDLVKYISAHGQAIARVDRTGATTYLHRDHLGSVRTLSDDGGYIVDERDFGAWGSATGPFAFPGVVEAFAGLRRDDDHGLMSLGARSYDPDATAFLSADSIVPDVYLPQTLNAYSYAMNNPATLVDPSGHCAQEQWHATDYGSIGVCSPDTGEVGSTVPNPVAQELQHQYVVDEGWFESIVSGNSEPSFGKSMIPVIGSGQTMIYHYKHGNYVRGVIYTVLTISDVILVGTIAKGVIKIGIKGGAALLASQFGQGVKLMVMGEWRAFGETFRLLTGKAHYGVKELFYNADEFAAVSKQYWQGTATEVGAQLQHLWVMNSTRWVPQGIRNAGFNLLEIPAAFNHWMSNGVSNQVFRLAVKTGLKAELIGVYNATQQLLGLREPQANPPQPQQPQQNLNQPQR
jgi:RHS repeat-associated protein